MHAWAKVCHVSWRSKSVLTGVLSRCMQYWLKNRWPDQALFNHYLHTTFISNSAIFCNNSIDWFVACVHAQVHAYMCKWFVHMRTHEEMLVQIGLQQQWRLRRELGGSLSGRIPSSVVKGAWGRFGGWRRLCVTNAMERTAPTSMSP